MMRSEDFAADVLNPLEQFLAHPLFGQLLEALIGAVVIGVVFRIASVWIPRYVREGALRYRFRKTISLIGYGLVLLYVASVFSDSAGQLTVILGATGAGVAFALQEVIASLAGWIALSFGQFYKSGDRVQLGGIIGDVIDISMLRTTLMECGDWVKGDLYNGRIVRVANSFVFKEPVYNYSGDFPFLWEEVKVPVTHGGDHQLAREILLRVTQEVTGDYTQKAEAHWQQMLQKYRIEAAQVEPMVTLVANDNWIEFTVRYVVDYKLRRRVKDQLFSQILDEFARTEGRVSFASATFQLVEAPTLNVTLDNNG